MPFECRVYDKDGFPYENRTIPIDCMVYPTKEEAKEKAREWLKEHPTDLVDIWKQPDFATGDAVPVLSLP